ncbi:hypothetical protein LZ30DRAFT_295250 [Colletotrichum cereale]|nr:hypothetical protein LZ30DRAFT_295250 [Colletotrichum cereale]
MNWTASLPTAAGNRSSRPSSREQHSLRTRIEPEPRRGHRGRQGDQERACTRYSCTGHTVAGMKRAGLRIGQSPACRDFRRKKNLPCAVGRLDQVTGTPGGLKETVVHAPGHRRRGVLCKAQAEAEVEGRHQTTEVSEELGSTIVHFPTGSDISTACTQEQVN